MGHGGSFHKKIMVQNIRVPPFLSTIMGHGFTGSRWVSLWGLELHLGCLFVGSVKYIFINPNLPNLWVNCNDLTVLPHWNHGIDMGEFS